MRMRKKRNGSERILACSDILVPKETEFTEILQMFGDQNRALRLEIGCGKGSFAVGSAKKEKDVNFLAVERVADVACLALEKAKKAEADGELDGTNLRFYIGNADELLERIPDGALEMIYLNFSDPWPKTGYAKRRLTHSRYLTQYKRILMEGGELRMKTDNDGLFEFTLEELAASGCFDIYMQTTDLHASEYAADNVVTEYERNFSEKGKNLNAVFAKIVK